MSPSTGDQKALFIPKYQTMRPIILILSLLLSNCLLAQPLADSLWHESVKTAILEPVGADMEPPVIRMGQLGEVTGQLQLRFDILGTQPEQLRWRILHCDAKWQPDGLEPVEFISGSEEGDIENYQYSFTTRRDFVNYYQQIPDKGSTFIASGNYIVAVSPLDSPDSILLTKRFLVWEDLTSIDAMATKPSSGHGDIMRDQELSIDVTPRSGSMLPLQASYYTVVVQQNGRRDLMREMPFNGYSGSAMSYQWKRENNFPGGNCFRYFDLSNLWAAMYHVQRIERLDGETVAFLQPDEDRSGKNYTQYSSLNGGMKINIRERQNPNIEADYVWVIFSLPMERPFLNGSVHIVGDLTQWSTGDNSRMEWNQKYKAYTKQLLLKQGYYAYQLLFLPTGESEALTATLEGDHFATPNDYTIYIYYRITGARFDRLVGVRTISAGIER